MLGMISLDSSYGPLSNITRVGAMDNPDEIQKVLNLKSKLIHKCIIFGFYFGILKLLSFYITKNASANSVLLIQNLKIALKLAYHPGFSCTEEEVLLFLINCISILIVFDQRISAKFLFPYTD